jgi:multicomponent Na+:H+ antiporter subunit E
MYRTISLNILLFAIWLLWSGHYTSLILSFGVLSCLLTVYLCQRMGIVDLEGHPIHLLGGFLAYIPWLAWALVRANIDIARRILTPSLPISPRLIRVKASQKTHLGQVIYANSITLTPGTVSVDVEEGCIEVHALTQAAAEDLLGGEMDRRVTRLENED